MREVREGKVIRLNNNKISPCAGYYSNSRDELPKDLDDLSFMDKLVVTVKTFKALVDFVHDSVMEISEEHEKLADRLEDVKRDAERRCRNTRNPY